MGTVEEEDIEDALDRMAGEAICDDGGFARAEWSALVKSAADYIREIDSTFDMRWNADMRAIKTWQKAHPGNDLVWPDRADMVVWLLDELDKERKRSSDLGWQINADRQGGA